MPNRITPAPGVAGALAKARAEGQGLSPDRVSKREREAEELALIGKIADRADAYIKASGQDFNPADWKRENAVIMLLQVKKANPTLDLQKFLDFDDFNFGHDFFGIAKHAKPPSGKLGNHFLPRAMRG